jgi:tetratricopeptide (TPR) repeat protein
LAAFYVQTKDYEKGLEHFKKAAFPSDNRAENEFFFRSLAYKGVALYRTGKQEEGVRLLKEALVGYQGLESKPTGLFSDHEVSIAGIHAVLGNKREAYNWLYKSDWTNAALYDVQRDVWFSSMRGEKEFQSIVNEVMEEKKKIRDEIARLKVAGDWEIKDF